MIDFDEEDGPLYNRRISQMDQAERIAIKAGCLENCTDLQHDNVPLEAIQPQTLQNASSWKKVVMDEKNHIIANKKINYNTSISNKAKFFKKIEPKVKIVDYEFIKKMLFYEKNKDLRLSKEIACWFLLNEEQERAYNIISQHVISTTSTKLLMYLGEMGGTGKSQVIKAIVHFFRKEGKHIVLLQLLLLLHLLLLSMVQHIIRCLESMIIIILKKLSMM